MYHPIDRSIYVTFGVPHCMVVLSFSGRHLSNHMINRENRERVETARKMSRAQSQFKSDEDVFVELIIDELKRENQELKFALVAREEKLMVNFGSFLLPVEHRS